MNAHNRYSADASGGDGNLESKVLWELSKRLL